MNTLLLLALGLSAALFGAEGCCAPSQWEAVIGEWTTTVREHRRPHLNLENIAVAYDAMNRRVASSLHVRNKLLRTVSNFNERKVYVVYGEYCRYYRLRQPFRLACTGNATHLGSFTFGAGQESVKLNAWEMHTEHLKVEFTTTQHSCIPVTEAVAGRIGREYFASVMGYVDVRLGIRDPSVFNHPTKCSPGNDVDFEQHLDTYNLAPAVSYMMKKPHQ